MKIDYRIPFGDLKIGKSARQRIVEVLDSNWVSEGRFVREFEEKFAEKFGWKHAIATSSGSTAAQVIWSAIREWYGGVGVIWGRAPVITPACAFVSTANSLLAAGCIPIFADVKIETLNLDPESVRNKINLGLKFNDAKAMGIQFVMNMGRSIDASRVQMIDDTPVFVIDACEGHGGLTPQGGDEFRESKACDIHELYPLAVIFSFYVAHMIIAGEGGMICTDDDQVAALCQSIKCHGYGEGPRFDFARIGYNSKMNDLTAAVGLEGLERFDENFAKRREVRRKLIEALSPMEDELILYRDSPGEVISPHAFPIVLKDPEGDIRPLYEHLDKSGIQVKTLFGSLPTQHAAFSFLGHKPGDFPVAERIGRTGLHLPCNEFMNDGDVTYIADRIGEFCQGKI